jgi:hypothetical protein
MSCNGIDLVSPIDRMPPGNFPYLFNVRVVEEGRIEGRPGYTDLMGLLDGDIPNSIRRLNDPDKSYSPAGYIYVGGGSKNLYVGTETSYAPVYDGFSGNPLSLVNFRPDQSPESWMYVYDANRLVKVRPDGTLRSIGLPPPPVAPSLEYGIPANAPLTDGASAETWTGSSPATATSGTDRTGGSLTVSKILYNVGTTGWCQISPSAAASWAGNRTRVKINTEEVVVRDILPAISSTTIQGITYDGGPTGTCSIVLTGSPTGLARNSLIQISSELVRVVEVIPDPSGVFYSIRAATQTAHAAGETVTGLVSWYVYTANAHVTGESITSVYVDVTGVAALGSTATETASINAGSASGRPIDPANDYFHISVYLANASVVTSLILKVDIGDASFTENYWTWTIPGTSLADGWNDLTLTISSGVLVRNDPTRSFATIAALQAGLVTTAASNFGFTAWYFFGTYGPEVPPNSPVGIIYQSRFRDSSTGAHSVPGPQNRQALFPIREEIIVTPLISITPGVDTIDIYRLGGTVTSFLYVGSAANSFGVTYLDSLPDVSVLDASEPPDLTAIQPWPLLGLPLSGTVSVSGTSVTWTSGNEFPLHLLSATVIEINGTAYQIYGQPTTPTSLQLFLDAGVLSSASFLIASPTVAGQALPYAFGPLEGPFAPVVFALGDPVNGGTLYYSNFSDADSASDQNSLELANPSEPLISGGTWNGIVFAGSRETLFRVQYSFLTTLGASSNVNYQWQKIPSPSGMWSRWACCTTPIGLAFLGRDGIYIATDQGAQSISDSVLYPLFPHDAQPASPVNSGSNIILPVDMTAVQYLRLSYTDGTIRFSYVDSGGNSVTLIYEISKKRWFLNNYADKIQAWYLVEGTGTLPESQQILGLSLDQSQVYLAGGNTDNNSPIFSLVLTPSLDGGDERAQKLYEDAMIEVDGVGNLSVAAAFDFAQTFSAVPDFILTGLITQIIQPIAAADGIGLHLNIGAKFAWTGGPGGPRLYAWEPSWYEQPYLTTHLQTQFINLSLPGWKHARRLYAALISTTPVNLTILTQDGRFYGLIPIPSSGGSYRQFPIMLPQCIKDLAFSFVLDAGDQPFAFFPSDFVIEFKQWTEASYIDLAVFKS